MTGILYGNLRVEVIRDAGARVQRVGFGQAAVDLLRPSQAGTPWNPLMLGREREVAEAFAAIEAGQPAGFFGSCGYGKTTLLQNVTAAAPERGIASRSIYLRASGDRIEDLLQDLVTELFVCEQPVKLTPQESAQVLGQVSAVIAIDDLRASQDQIEYLVRVLPNCRLVIGSARPVLGDRGSSYQMGSLPEDPALALMADELGRPLTADERAAARRLVAAVDGQPLHLRQCAALAREHGHSLRSLARQAMSDPEVLDQLSINSLARHQRRALAVLALAAGTLLPAAVVEAIGQIAYVAEWLQSLHRHGLAEQRHDRFGLPACKAESYRQLLFKDLNLAASARGLSNWLISADPLGADSQSAAEAAVTMIEFAGERGEWTTVVQLARAAERVLFFAGRWEAWHHVLTRGLIAAKASGDKAAQAFFAHQQGTLAFCQDQLGDAYQLLQQALTLRTQIGDDAGATLTRYNLQLLQPPEPPPSRSRMTRRALRALGGLIGTLALTVGTVVLASVIHGGHGPSQTFVSPSPSVSRVKDSASGSASLPSSQGASQPVQTSGSTAATLHLSPQYLPTATVSVADTQQITASGGAPPYSYIVTSGGLPPGLILSSGGMVSGTPTTAGSYQFTITATDAAATPDTGSAVYTLLIKAPPPTITLTPETLPVMLVGSKPSQQISATGGTAPYTFSWSGSLPPGLSLSTTGVISGSPTTAGSYQFTITATDASTPADSGSRPYTLDVQKPTQDYRARTRSAVSWRQRPVSDRFAAE
jgi:hypothetical protein